MSKKLPSLLNLLALFSGLAVIAAGVRSSHFFWFAVSSISGLSIAGILMGLAVIIHNQNNPA
jgi:hypothetical protein